LDAEISMLADIDVTYEDDDVADHALVAAAAVETTCSSAVADELSPVVTDAILDWVVREEVLYEDILGIPQDGLGEPDPEVTVEARRDHVAGENLGDILGSGEDQADDVAPEEMPGARQDDLGEMEWIKSEDGLAETPCEV